MPAKLYVVQGSHPSATAERALELKGVPFKRVELPELAHIPLQKRRFGAPTVPGVVFEDGEKVQGSVAILHRLDERVPDPPLLPPDAEERRKVEELERFGDEVLQPLVRRLAWWGLAHNGAAMPSYTAGSRWRMPAPLTRTFGPLIAKRAGSVHGSSDESVKADLAALPGHLDRVDAAIAEGTIGGEPPNAADLQLASSLRLLLTYGDVAPMLEGRPAADLARRVFPEWAGDMPAGTLPV